MKWLQSIVTTLTVRRLFLVDGLGAAVTALMLGLLLTTFKPAFGMPERLLIPLSVVAACFAVYSLVCHVRAVGPRFLMVIAVANTLYCVCTSVLVLMLRGTLTWLGVAYFLGEILVVGTLVVLETSVALRERTRDAITAHPSRSAPSSAAR